MPVALNGGGAVDIFLTLNNTKGEQLLFNYPVKDLIIGAGGVNINRQRLFRLEDIDLDNSYYTQSTNVGYAATARLFILNFHY